MNTLLVVVLLIATTGVTLNKHYCMGRLKSIAVNIAATPCTDMDEGEKMPCCDDVAQELKVTELSTVTFDFDATPDLYKVASIDFIELPEVNQGITEESVEVREYAPPLPHRDLPILHQAFLI